jgi:hypothetical protein
METSSRLFIRPEKNDDQALISHLLSPNITHGIAIESERLILKPLTYEQLVKYVACDNSL